MSRRVGSIVFRGIQAARLTETQRLAALASVRRALAAVEAQAASGPSRGTETPKPETGR